MRIRKMPNASVNRSNDHWMALKMGSWELALTIPFLLIELCLAINAGDGSSTFVMH